VTPGMARARLDLVPGPDRPTPDAVHEAAHAVVAVLLGCRFPEVSLPDATGYGGGVETVAPLSADGNLSAAAISLAGPLAERRIDLVDDWDVRYRAHRREFEGRCAPDGRAASEAGEEVAERLLQRTELWEAVLEVAQLLDEHAPRTYEEIQIVVVSHGIEIVAPPGKPEPDGTDARSRSVFRDR
jgi:hypothetical protein